jgi:tungstate transport system permease protein
MRNALDTATASLITPLMDEFARSVFIATRLMSRFAPERGGAVGIAGEPIGCHHRICAWHALGAFLVLTRLPVRTAILVLANALFGLPLVVVGLLCRILSDLPPKKWTGLSYF